MRYVIIGNSAAAVGCIEGIRQRDREGKITIIGEEPYPVYSRPLISYLLAGKTDEVRMRYRPEDFYEKNRCTLCLGERATAIHPDRRTVSTEPVKGGAGREIPYDKLLVATGSRPFVPPIGGLEQVEKRFCFMTLQDARALEKAISKESRVLILGAGLIGLKCAEGIAGRVGEITVVDLADRVLPSILDAEAAALVQKHLESYGLRFRLSRTVQSLSKNEAMLSDGEKIPFDLLVLAVGVRPRTELVSQAGGKVGRGVCTDLFCRTSLPDIYSAGDCAESFDVCTGEERVLALLPNAYMQGECAGLHMTGREENPYDRAIPMNAIGFFGLHMITAGVQSGEAYCSKTDKAYKKLYTKDNRLMGYILLGEVSCAGIYTALVRERTPLSSLDFERIREKPQLMAFSRAERGKMLASAH